MENAKGKVKLKYWVKGMQLTLRVYSVNLEGNYKGQSSDSSIVAEFTSGPCTLRVYDGAGKLSLRRCAIAVPLFIKKQFKTDSYYFYDKEDLRNMIDFLKKINGSVVRRRI